MRLLICGSSGMFGFALTVEALIRGHTVWGTYHGNPVYYKAAQTFQADLTDTATVRGVISGFKPHWVVNCAGYTNVDGCETDPKLCIELNENLPRILAEECKRAGVNLAHISSDMVFDGELEYPFSYVETSPTHPINVYGKSKRKAERIISQKAGRFITIRTNIFGWSLSGTHSLPEIILNTFNRGETFHGFIDVYSTPIFTNDLANVLLDMIEQNRGGLYHIGGANMISKYSFAQMTARIFGFSVGMVDSIPISSIKTLRAKRPKNMCLSSGMARQSLNFSPPTVEAGLWRMKEMESTNWYNQFLGGTSK